MAYVSIRICEQENSIHVCGKLKFPILLLMVLYVLFLGNAVRQLFQGEGISSPMVYTLLLGALILTLILLGVKRTNVFMYEEYLTHRKPIGSTDMDYRDIARVELIEEERVEYRRRGRGRGRRRHRVARKRISRFYGLFDRTENRVIKIPVSLFRSVGEQRKFFKELKGHNPNIDL